MKAKPIRLLCTALLASASAQAQTYTNYIAEVYIYPGSETLRLIPNVANSDMKVSEEGVPAGGARFELHTVNSASSVPIPALATTYVSAYRPIATVTINSEDQTGTTPRTRADRPFQVVVDTTNLLTDENMPAASKSVNFYHKAQSCGEGGTGLNIDREMAQTISQGILTGDKTFYYTIHSVPGANLAKARGEETFMVESLADPDSHADAEKLDRQTIQIWPVADGTLAGLTNGQVYKTRLPQLTVTLNDLYPLSTTYVQAYPGPPAPGTVGTQLPTQKILNQAVPANDVLVMDNYDEVVIADGQWTFELLTSTPFGVDRLDYVTVTIDKSLDVKGTFTTLE